MTRQAVSSDQAPAALGPYSQAIVAGGFVFCSGTAGIDPATGAAGDGIEAQTEQALQNLAAILKAAGASMADLVKVTIYYEDVDDFARLNEVYARHMPTRRRRDLRRPTSSSRAGYSYRSMPSPSFRPRLASGQRSRLRPLACGGRPRGPQANLCRTTCARFSLLTCVATGVRLNLPAKAAWTEGLPKNARRTDE
jgi:2-iminobutanoate/2-iminopropanoate deaminase